MNKTHTIEFSDSHFDIIVADIDGVSNDGTKALLRNVYDACPDGTVSIKFSVKFVGKNLWDTWVAITVVDLEPLPVNTAILPKTLHSGRYHGDAHPRNLLLELMSDFAKGILK